MNFQTFSQVAFAFAVTPWLLAQGLAYALIMALVGGTPAGAQGGPAAHRIGLASALTPAMRQPALRRPLVLVVALWSAGIGAAAAQNAPATAPVNAPFNAIARENQQPGTTDWLVRRVEPAAANTREDRYTRQRAIEGYVSRTSVRAGETLTAFVSTSPAASYRADVYRLGYYGGTGGRLMARLGPFQAFRAARARRGHAAARRGALGDVVRHPDRTRLGQRRLRRQAHHGRPRPRELPGLGGARRSPRRPDVPGVGSHLAGLQPLAGLAVPLRLEGRALAHHAGRQGQLRSAVRLLLQPAARDVRAARRRGRASSCCGSSRSPTGSRRTATT